MRLNRAIALGASLLIVLGACTSGATSSPSAASAATSGASASAASEGASASVSGATPDIKIGSDDFYESAVVAEMWAQVLEKAGYVERRDRRLEGDDGSGEQDPDQRKTAHSNPP